MQWNISLQREITRDLLIEASYVGSRSAWYEADSLINLNATSTARLSALALDITNPATQSLLTATFDSGSPGRPGSKSPTPAFPPA